MAIYKPLGGKTLPGGQVVNTPDVERATEESSDEEDGQEEECDLVPQFLSRFRKKGNDESDSQEEENDDLQSTTGGEDFDLVSSNQEKGQEGEEGEEEVEENARGNQEAAQERGEPVEDHEEQEEEQEGEGGKDVVIDVATAQEIVNFVGQLMPQRGHATLKAANEALDNISETSDTENVDLEGPFRDLPIPSDMDERDVAVNRQDNLLQYGVRRLAFVQCLTGAEIPEENLNNVFTPEGSNAYPVLKVYSHSIERNAISFGALCPRTQLRASKEP